VTIYRLCNAKLYEKTSSSLVEAASKCIPIIMEKTFLLWQPPTYPQLSLICEILIEWQSTKQAILIVTPHPEELSAELQGQGFKVVKIGIKTEDKLLTRNCIVVSSPSTVCCDVLKNYAYSRVLVEAAQTVS
jgi:hypothetical protein